MELRPPLCAQTPSALTPPPPPHHPHRFACLHRSSRGLYPFRPHPPPTALSALRPLPPLYALTLQSWLPPPPPNLSAHSPHCPHHPDLGHTVSVLRSFTVFALTALTSPNARRLSTVSVRIHHRIMPSWSWNYRNCWQRTGPAINTHEEVSTLLIPILFFLVTSPDYFQHLLPSLDSHLSAFGVGGTGGSS